MGQPQPHAAPSHSPIAPPTAPEINKKKIKGKLVIVTNIETDIATDYISISEVASALNIAPTTLRNYIKNKTFFV